ncbi:MAG: hypothetical protein Q9170_005753 [Blastenia crenularia]
MDGNVIAAVRSVVKSSQGSIDVVAKRSNKIFCADPTLPGDVFPPAPARSALIRVPYTSNVDGATLGDGTTLDNGSCGTESNKSKVDDHSDTDPTAGCFTSTPSSMSSLSSTNGCEHSSNMDHSQQPVVKADENRDNSIDTSKALSHTNGSELHPAQLRESMDNDPVTLDKFGKQIEQYIRQANRSSEDLHAVFQKAAKELKDAPLRIQNRWRIFKILLQAS